jgi:hypothetical protein
MKDYVMFTDLTEPSYGMKQEPPKFDHMSSLLDTIQKMKEDEAKKREALKRTAVHQQEEQLAQRPR